MGWWDLVRMEQQAGRTVKVETQITPHVISRSHRDYAKLVGNADVTVSN